MHIMENLINTDELREELAQTGAIFQTTTDSELIAYEIARARVHTDNVEEAILKTASRLRGAYGLVIASPRKLIGVRDPLGLNPGPGKRNNSYVIASESCALSAIGAQFVNRYLPLERLLQSLQKVSLLICNCVKKEQAHCIFEYIYFARLDSQLDGISVYESRLRAGEALAKSYPADADLVTGVPDQNLLQHRDIPMPQAFRLALLL